MRAEVDHGRRMRPVSRLVAVAAATMAALALLLVGATAVHAAQPAPPAQPRVDYHPGLIYETGACYVIRDMLRRDRYRADCKWQPPIQVGYTRLWSDSPHF
ncbi:hypothetical protein WEH80_18450 [Actinomycetes bacterium KLBMP 9759]